MKCWIYYPRYLDGAPRVLSTAADADAAYVAENEVYDVAVADPPLSPTRSQAARERMRGVVWTLEDAAGPVPAWRLTDLTTQYVSACAVEHGQRAALKRGDVFLRAPTAPRDLGDYEGMLYELRDDSLGWRENARTRLLASAESVATTMKRLRADLAPGAKGLINSLGEVQGQGSTVDVVCAAYALHTKQVAHIEALILGKPGPW